MNDKIKQLYDVVGQEYDLGTYDEFKARLQQDDSRKKFYDVVGQEYDLGDYGSFSSIVTSYPDSASPAPSAPSAEEIAEEMQPKDETRFGILGKMGQYMGSPSAYVPMPQAEEREELTQAEIDQRAAMRQMLQENGTIDRMEEMEKEARKNKFKAFGEALAYTPQVSSFGVSSNIYKDTEDQLADAQRALEASEEHRQNKAMEQTLDVALDKARAGEWGGIGENNVGNGVVDFGLGLWDSATRMSTWDFGVSDMLNGLTIAQVVEKWKEDPDSLTATERNLLDAMGMATAVQEAYADQTGIGYSVGESLPQSLGFMASMYLNPASGLGKSLARQAVKKYGRQSIAKNLARIGGDIAETAIMTATTGGGRVVADALERINGQSTYEIDPETGLVMYGGQEDQKTVGEAVVKAIGSNFIENYSEALGEYFDPLLGMSRRLAAGGLRKMNLDKWADALSDVEPSQMAASIRSLREKAKFGGVFGEIMEEEVGMALNAITVGDYTFSKEEADASNGKKQWIFDLENQLTTALSCAIMSGALTGVETIGNVRYRREMERSVADAEKAARAAVGDEMIAQIDQASPEGMVDILRDAYMDQSLSLQQKRVLAEYATQRVRMQYYNAADAKARRQVNVTQQNTIDAYEAGRHAQLPQYYNIDQAYRRSEAAINERENAEEIWDAIRLMNNMDENERQNIMRDFSEEDQELIRNWRYNAYRWQGAVNHRAEQVEDLVDEYAGQVNPYTRPDGTVTTAILGDNVVYVMNEAENGDAVVYTNDGRKIFCKMRDLEHVQQHNAEELIERFRQQTTEAVNQETEKNLNYPSEVFEPAVNVEVQTADGKTWLVTAVNGDDVQVSEMVLDRKSNTWNPNGAPKNMTRTEFMDWQKAELDRKKANTYEQGDELTFYVNGEPISAEITGIDPEGNYYVQISHLADGLDKAVSDVYTAEELRKLTTPSSKVSEKTAENESTPTEEIKQSVSNEVTNSQSEENVTEPTAEVAESVNTALSRVPKDAKGNPLYEQADSDTAWDAIVEETGGDAEMAQRVAADMLEDKKAALTKMQKGKPKKGATVAEKIANEKAHIAAIAQAEQEVAAWEKIANTEARRREAAMSEADRYAAEMEQKNISEGLAALGEAQSLEEYVLAQLAGGAYKLRWNDKENGTKGFGSHTGLSTEEMTDRLSMVDNKNGLTPEEIAHSIVENMDASFGEVDVMDVTDMVIDAVSTYESRRAMLNGMVESRAELIRQQEIAEQEAKDAWYMEQYHATEEELAAYNEYLAEFAGEIYGEDSDYEQRIATFAEIQLEYDNQGTDAGLRSSADQGEGLASDREGGRSVGETEQLNQREVFGDAAGVAASEDQGIGSSVSAEYDVENKPTANVFEMAEEVQKKRESKKKSNDKLAEENHQQEENRSETRGVGNRPQLQDASSYESFVERVEEYPQRSDKGTGKSRPSGTFSISYYTQFLKELFQNAHWEGRPSEEVAGIIRRHNAGKTLLARTEDERELLSALRALTNNEIQGELSNINNALQSDEYTDEEKEELKRAKNLITRFVNRGERNAVVEALTGAKLGEKLPLSKIDELFEMYNSDANVAELYGRVRAIAEQIGLDFWFEEMEDRLLGGYLHSDNRVRLNAHMLYCPRMQRQGVASTIVHEMLHAVAGYAVYTQKDIKLGLTPKVQLSKQVLSAANTIINIYEKAVKGNPALVHQEYDIEKEEWVEVADYGTTSVHEMLSEISNPEFRDKLKQIEYKNRSVWQWIVDTLKSMFTQSSDVTNPTAYDSMAKALDVLINEFSEDAYRKYSGLEESAMKLSAEENLRFREGDNQDAAYMDAVERGDMETAQRMVDEAARKAMKKTKVVDKDKQPMLMSHHTDAEGFYVFDRGKIGTGQGQAFLGAGFNFSRGSGSSVYGSRNIQAYLDARKPLRSDRNTLSIYQIEQIIKELNAISGDNIEYNFADNISRAARAIYDYGGDLDTYASLCTAYSGETRDVLEVFEKLGFDSTIEYGDDKRIMNAVVFNSHQIKSADPVTYDDNGNVIPLSERFNLKEEDIRFRDGAPFFSNAERAVENIKQQKATPEQWLAMIKKDGGLKAGEDKWMGLSDWLNEQKEKGVKTLTKDEVLQFIRENQIEIEEVEYGDSGVVFEWADNLEGEYAESKNYPQARIYMYTNEAYYNGEPVGIFDTFDEAEDALAEKITGQKYRNSTRMDYSTSGLKNNKEIAFVVPSIEPWNQSDTIHFGDAGEGRAVAWVRFGETIDEDGNRVLVIDEVQSKRHDEGRAKGYKPKGVGNIQLRLNEISDRLVELGQIENDSENGLTDEQYEEQKSLLSEQRMLTQSGAIPDAPFDKNYHELVMKRMLRYAAENGFDKVAWTKGKQQARRYDLAKHVSSIEYKPLANGHYNVIAYSSLGYPLDGVPMVYDSEQAIADVFGKDIAQQITQDVEENRRKAAETEQALSELKEKRKELRRRGVDEDSAEFEETLEEFSRLSNKLSETQSAKFIEGTDLSIGGEGMKGFYDEMIPRFMNKYTKKWGTKVGEVTLPEVEEAGRTMWSVDVTPEMRESVMQGQPMFREGMGAISDREVSYENDPIAKWQGKPRYYGKRAAAFAERERARMQKGVEEAAKILGIEVEIITDASTLKGRKAKAKGWYDINAKKVVVVVPNHVSKGDAVRTVLHEGVAHHGLRELFGDGFDAMLDNIYNNVAPELKARIDAIAERTGVSTSVATEEYLASLAEETNFEEAKQTGWWVKIKGYFMKMLRKLGMPGLTLREEITDNELRYLLWRSYQNLVDPNSFLKPLGYLDDVAKQKELKVGNYAENTMATPRAAEEMSLASEDAIRYRFIGENGAENLDRYDEATTRLDNLKVAREMEAAEKDAKTIKMATGWERGADGKWRYEVEDFDKFDVEGLVELSKRQPRLYKEYQRYKELLHKRNALLMNGGELSDAELEEYDKIGGFFHGGLRINSDGLSNYIDDEELFRAYPKLANVIVKFVKMEGADGGFNKRHNTIYINSSLSTEEKKRSLVHEVQHAIQDIEGFAEGGSVNTISAAMENNSHVRNEVYELLDSLGYNEWLKSDDAADLATDVVIGRNFNTAYSFSYSLSPEIGESLRKKLDEAHRVIEDNNRISGGERGLTPYEQYNRLGGEVEARNVESRMGMTLEERRASLASETEDVAREDQIFLYDAVESAAIGNGRPFGANNPYNNKRKATRSQRDEIVKIILSKNYDSVGSDIIRVGDSLFLIDHTDNSEFQNILDTEKKPDGQGYGIRKKYTFANITEEDIYEIVTNIAKSYNYNEGSIRIRLQELGLEPTALSKFDFNAAIVGGNRDNGVGTEGGRRQRDATHSNTGSSYGGIHKGGIFGGDGGKRNELERASGIDRNAEEIIAEVEREAAALGVPVRIVRSVDELPDEDTRKRAVDGQLKGYFDPRTGEVALYEPNTDDANDAKRTILHETVGHKGLRQLIGEERYDKAMVQLMYMIPSDVRDAVLRRAERHGWNAAIAMDEYLAEQAERDVQPTWWGKVNAKIRAILRNLGFNVKLTDADVAYLLWRSRKKLMGDTAFDMATNAILKQAARKSAEADAWNEQAFKDAEIRDFEKNELKQWRYRTGEAQNEYERHLETISYKFSEAYQDRMASLKVLQEAVEKESGKKIADWENGWMDENRMSSVNLAEIEMFRESYLEMIAKYAADIEKGGVGHQGLIDYMFAKHGLERNETMARERAEKEAEGNAAKEATLYVKYRDTDFAGLTALTGKGNVADAEADAMQMVSDFEANHSTDLLWGALREANNEILRISYDAGIIDEDTYNNLRDKYKYYIPLRGFAEKTAEDVYLYVDGHNSPYNAPIKTAKGRKSKADDPFAHIESMATSAIVEANRNRLKQKMLYMAERHHTDLMSVSDVWVESVDVRMDDGTTVQEWHTVFANIPDDATTEQAIQIQKAFEEDMEQKAKSNPDKYAKVSEKPNIPYRVVKQESGNQHQIVVKRGGKDVVIIVNGNPRAAQAVNGLTNRQATENKFIRALRWVNRQQSANYTARSIKFMVTNLSKDSQYTKVMAFLKEPLSYGARFWKNWWLSIVKVPALLSKYNKTIRKEAGGLDMNKPIERMFYEFISQGGETGYTHINTIEDYKKEMKLMILKHKGGIVGMGIKSWDALTGTLRGFNQWAEDTSRFAAYMTSREAGRSLTKSVNDAKEISVNFNRAGSGSRMVGEFSQSPAGYIAGVSAEACLIMWNFFNANVQGISNFYREAAKHPYKFAVVVGANMLYGFLHAMMASAGDDDEDKDNKYYDLPAWKRRMCHTFRVGDKWLCIPMAISFAPFYALGELAYSYFSGREKYTDAEIASEVAKIAATAALPIDVTANHWWVPDAVAPAAEVAWFNEDWTGKPIYKERYDDGKPTWELAYKSTNPRLVAISKAINEATNKDIEVVDAKGNVTVLEDYKDRGWADNDFWTNAAGWEHMMEGYLGGNVKFVNDIAKSIQSVKNVDLRNVQTYPIINSFMMEGGGKVYVTRGKVYEAKKEIEEMKSKINSYGRETKDSDLPEADRKRAEELREALLNRDMQTIATFENLEKQRQSYQTKYDENPNAKEIISTYDKYNRPVGKKEVLVKDLLFDVMHKQLDVWDDYKFGEDYKPIISIGN